MKTELGRGYREALNDAALTQIQLWAATAAEACHAYGDQAEDRNIAAAFHADAAKFARLDKALRACSGCGTSTPVEPHAIVDDATDGDCDLQTLAWVHPATEEAVQTVTHAPLGTGDGRSPWVWVRLRDGTLILGMFPQGDTYMEFSDADCAPWGNTADQLVGASRR